MSCTTHAQAVENMVETLGAMIFNDMVDWKNQELVEAVRQLALVLEDVVGLTEEEDEA